MKEFLWRLCFTERERIAGEVDEERAFRGEKEMKSVLDGENLDLHRGEGEEDNREDDERVAIFASASSLLRVSLWLEKETQKQWCRVSFLSPWIQFIRLG